MDSTAPRPLRTECPPQGNFTELDTAEYPPHTQKTSQLTRVYLELTSACNSRCPGCLNESFITDFSRRTLKPEFRQLPLNAERWLALLDRLPPSLESVILSGGEPTLHPEFNTIVSGLEARQFRFVIFSNGRWPDPQGLLAVLQASSHFSGFLISLHGIDAESHETFMGVKGSFRETLSNIRKAVAAGLPVSLSTVITRQNITALGEFPRLALALGVEEISFNRYLHSPERLTQYPASARPPTPSQLREAVRRIEALRQAYAGRLHIGYGPTIPQCFEPSASKMCSAGEASLVIDPWGNVKPCLHTDLLCGNLLEQDFEVVWESKNLQMWRGMGEDGCLSNNRCSGGCRAMALAWGQKDPLIPVQALESIFAFHTISLSR